MKPNTGLPEAVAFVALLFLSSIFVAFLLLAIEAFLSSENAAAWAQAIGGIAAVLATSSIAIAESKRSRRLISAQNEMQQKALDHSLSMLMRTEIHQRRAALASVRAAYLLVAEMTKVALERTQPTTSFCEVWKPEFEQADSLLKNVNYSHLTEANEIACVSEIRVRIFDIWDGIQELSNDETPEEINFHRVIVKIAFGKFFNLVSSLAGNENLELNSVLQIQKDEITEYRDYADRVLKGHIENARSGGTPGKP